ncbi:hypothetical protein [Parafrankia sp. EUN1f]|uniref:hypothetical protein n=1 Tax=Parafrankia sp. EUN1f TaxID=102897 RepID=UPI0001C44613|nr:hypothetical protein [Parafrankia sp. EUN1f]EFC85812.1 hypothetical protein FrEUN1fDRAFT_1131 [Parafrankia sp. EUN1f]
MTEYLRLDPAAMRTVAADLDRATDVGRRMSSALPTLTAGYDLPLGLGRQAQAELSRLGGVMARAGGALHGLGRDVRARAVLAELADAAEKPGAGAGGAPGAAPAGLADRLRRIVEDFECPLDDPVRNLIHESTAAAAGGAAGGAKAGVGQLREALNDVADGEIANRLREGANRNLDQCQPPVELPEPLPPPPPPPPPPGLLDRVADAVDGAVDDVVDGARQVLEDLPASGDQPGGGLPPLPVPPPIVPIP